MKAMFFKLFAVVAVLAAGIPGGPASAADNTPTALGESNFDGDLEGWTIQGDPEATWPKIVSAGPENGAAETKDAATGDTMYWVAPADFLGDVSDAYGGRLNFEHKGSAGEPYNADELILEGAGITLTYNNPEPNPDTTNFELESISILATNTGWRNATANRDAYYSDFTAVLGNLTALKIRAEYVNGVDYHWLDNVFLFAGDQDEDGIDNVADRCDTQDEDFDEVRDDDGCPEYVVPTTATIEYRRPNDVIRGDVTASGVARCVTGRTVYLFKRREGPDLQTGDAAMTGSDGEFAFDLEGRRGTFYVKVTQRTRRATETWPIYKCLGDTSNNVTP